MADGKQITARIRRARASKDPVGQLSNLYEKTRDAMVAFELGKLFENSRQNDEAAKWYSAAAERFRRADWKSKAQEAVVRLGGSTGETSSELSTQPAAEFQLTPPAAAAEEKELAFERNPEALESVVAVTSEVQQAAEEGTVAPSEARKSRHRRGRRGGRNRRRGSARNETAGPSELRSQDGDTARRELARPGLHPPNEPAASRATHSRAVPSLPVEPLGEPSGPSVKGRYGDPGLSSRISLLEMQFRRLLTCPPVKLDEADHAPVGPGVFVLTDADLTSYYYVEACQTLRVAIGNLLRSGLSRRGGDSIKPRLAEHLGIPETRAVSYTHLTLPTICSV